MVMNKEAERKEDNNLTEQEELFCMLYTRGGISFAGQHCKCYADAFKSKEGNISLKSRRLLAKPLVAARIKELINEVQNEIEVIATKLQVSETLKAVMEETATSSYSDKFGIDLSPAPLRAVSVNAAKALMSIYPIKHNQETRLKIEGQEGFILNVIVPIEKQGDEEQENKNQV